MGHKMMGLALAIFLTAGSSLAAEADPAGVENDLSAIDLLRSMSDFR